MREHFYRGFCKNENGSTAIYLNGEWIFGDWVEGYYTCFNGVEHRIYTGYAETDCGDYYPDWFSVIPETVGQYTGSTDIGDKKIFEGDIMKTAVTGLKQHIGVVEFADSSFGLRCTDGDAFFLCFVAGNYVVIGNIHKNPDLIGGKQE